MKHGGENTFYFRYQVPRRGNALCIVYELHPLKSSYFSSKKVTSRKSRKLWTKGPEWNNAVYVEKKKSHYFTHPVWEKEGDPYREQEKGKITWEKLKESKLVKLNKLK